MRRYQRHSGSAHAYGGYRCGIPSPIAKDEPMGNGASGEFLCEPSMFAKLWCWLVGHRYDVWQHFSGHSRRVVCDHCGGDWGMNDDCRAFVPWSEEFADMYRVMGHKVRARAALRRG